MHLCKKSDALRWKWGGPHTQNSSGGTQDNYRPAPATSNTYCNDKSCISVHCNLQSYPYPTSDMCTRIFRSPCILFQLVVATIRTTKIDIRKRHHSLPMRINISVSYDTRIKGLVLQQMPCASRKAGTEP
jgi:hypothetical protein